MMSHRPARLHRSAAGVAMIEVLIAMLVIALWLLGSATLQLSSLKLQQSAGSRYVAVALASELSETIEANAAGANAGHYTLAARAQPSSASTDCAQSYCSPQQLAQYNLAQWTGRVAAALPLEDMQVERATGADGLVNYTIRIRWRESLAQRGEANRAKSEILSVVMTRAVRNAGT